MHIVKEVKYFSDYKLRLTFDDKVTKIFDMSPYIKKGLAFVPLQ